MESYEELYRQVDAQFRILDKLYTLEHLLQEQIEARFKDAKIQITRTMGALLAGVFAVLPILVSVLDISWDSSPAWTIYVLCGLIGGVWFLQIRNAEKAFSDLRRTEELYRPEPLQDWHKYQLDTIAMYGNRCRLLDNIIDEMRHKLEEAEKGKDRPELKEQLERYEMIATYCREKISTSVKKSKDQFEAGSRSEEQHAEVVAWASPYLEVDGSSGSQDC